MEVGVHLGVHRPAYLNEKALCVHEECTRNAALLAQHTACKIAAAAKTFNPPPPKPYTNIRIRLITTPPRPSK